MGPDIQHSPVDIPPTPHSPDVDSDDENSQGSVKIKDRCSDCYQFEISNENASCHPIPSPALVFSSTPSFTNTPSGGKMHLRQETRSNSEVERTFADHQPIEPFATFDRTVSRELISPDQHDEGIKPTPSLVLSSSSNGVSDDDEDMDSLGPETPIHIITHCSYTLTEDQKQQKGRQLFPSTPNTGDLRSEKSSPEAMDRLSFPSSSSYIASPDLPEVYVPFMSKKKLQSQHILQMMKPRTPMPRALARLRSSLAEESRQRLSDGLGASGKVVPKSHADFISRLLPTKFLPVETGVSGWASKIFTDMAEWILMVC